MICCSRVARSARGANAPPPNPSHVAGRNWSPPKNPLPELIAQFPLLSHCASRSHTPGPKRPYRQPPSTPTTATSTAAAAPRRTLDLICISLSLVVGSKGALRRGRRRARSAKDAGRMPAGKAAKDYSPAGWKGSAELVIIEPSRKPGLVPLDRDLPDPPLLAKGIGQRLEDDVEITFLAIDGKVDVARLLAASDEVSSWERGSTRNRHLDLVAVGSLKLPVQGILFVVVAVAVADLHGHLQVAVVFERAQGLLEARTGDRGRESAEVGGLSDVALLVFVLPAGSP